MTSFNRLRAGGVAISLALLASCNTSGSSIGSGADLSEVQSRLDRIISGSQGDTVSAMIAAIEANQSNLVEIATSCESQGAGDSPALDAQCLAVSAQAYLLLAELPERPDSLEDDPNLLADDLLSRSAVACSRLPSNRHCHAIEGMKGLLGSGAAARELRNIAMGEGLIEREFALGRLSTFGEQARISWPALLASTGSADGEAAAVEARRRAMTNQACYVYWSTSEFVTPARLASVDDVNPITNASREALWAAVSAARLPPASDGVCTEESETCVSSRYVRLVRSCGPSPLGSPSS